MPHVEVLTELLEKISRSTAHVRIEVDYDGREFHWKLPQQNITASEWCPRELRQKPTSRCPHKIPETEI